MNAGKIKKLAKQNDPLLALACREWMRRTKKEDPVLEIIKAYRRRMFGSALICVVLIVASICTQSFIPISCGVGCLIFVWVVFRNDLSVGEMGANAYRFIRAITLMEEKTDAKFGCRDHEVHTSVGCVSNGMHTWLPENFLNLKAGAHEILTKKATDLKKLQLIPWRDHEASNTRKAFEEDHKCLSGLWEIPQDFGVYFA